MSKEYYKSASELMKAVGDPRGVFDATPQRLHDSLKDWRENEKVRILALLLEYSVRKMSVAATDANGHPLKKAHIARLLEMDRQNVGDAIEELIAEGKVAQVAGAGYRVCGDTPAPRLKKQDGSQPVSEEPEEPNEAQDEEGICNLYKLQIDYLDERLQQLTKTRRADFVEKWKRLADLEKQALRESAGAVRDQFTSLRKYLASSIDVKLREIERKDKAKPEPTLVTELRLKPEQLEFVQITDDAGIVQNRNGSLHKLQNVIRTDSPSLLEIRDRDKNSPPTPSQEGAERDLPAPNYWKGLLFAAERCGMASSPEEQKKILRRFVKYPLEEQQSAIEQLRIRTEGGEYTGDRYTPTLARYVFDQLWRQVRNTAATQNGNHDRKAAAREEFRRRTLEDLSEAAKRKGAGNG